MKFLFLQALLFILFLNGCGYEENSSVGNEIIKNSGNTAVDDKKALSLCDVGNNPAEFDGRIFSLKTRVTFGTENTVISDEKCSHRAVVTFKDEKAFAPLEKIREDGYRKKKTVFYADVEIQVKFINKPFTGCCTETPFQFEVLETSEVSPGN